MKHKINLKKCLTALCCAMLCVGSLSMTAFAISPSGAKPVDKDGTGAAAFKNNYGKYTEGWDTSKKALEVDKPEYQFKFKKTDDSVVTFLGDKASSSKGAKEVGDDIKDRNGTFNSNADEWDYYKGSNIDGAGYKITNCTIRQAGADGRPKTVKVDIVYKFSDYEAMGNDHKLPYLIIQTASAYPTFALYDVESVKMNMTVYEAGTKTPIAVKTNYTVQDIDGEQMFGFGDSGVEGMYVTSDSKLKYEHTSSSNRFWAPNAGTGDGSGVMDTDDRYAVAFITEFSEKTFIFGNVHDADKVNAWAHFDIESSNSIITFSETEPYKKVTDSDNLTWDKTAGSEKNVDENRLAVPSETFSYKVTQVIPMGISQEANYYKSFVMEDQIDTCLSIQSVKITQGGNDHTDDYTITTDGNKVVATAKAAALNSKWFYSSGNGCDAAMTIKAKISADAATLKAHGHMVESEATIENIASVTIDDDKKTTNKTKTITEFPPAPEKKVSDDDNMKVDFTKGEEKEVAENRITSKKESYTYHLKQKVLAGMSADDAFNSFELQDQFDKCLEIKDIKVMVNGADHTGGFDITKADNNVIIKAKDASLKENWFYNNGAAGSVDVYVTTKIKATTAELKAHGHVTEATLDVAIPNEKVVATIDGFKQESKSTLTHLILPPPPTKNVSDDDNLKYDLTAGGEVNVNNNRVENAAKPYTYTVVQKLPLGIAGLESFIMQDQIDTCLKINSIKVMNGTADITNSFTITKTGNKVVATAKADTLSGDAFYGTGAGSEIKMLISTQVGVDLATLKAHGHVNPAVTEAEFTNKADVTIDDEPQSSNTPKTIVMIPDPKIEKAIGKFEWKVGDHVSYTLKVENKNKNAVAANTVIDDISLPEYLAYDKGSIKVEGIKDYTVEEVGTGFKVKVPELRKEIITVTYTATALEDYDACTMCANGKVTQNQANVTCDLCVDDEDNHDIDRGWVNTPHIKIEKTSQKKQYNVGDTVNYTMKI